MPAADRQPIARAALPARKGGRSAPLVAIFGIVVALQLLVALLSIDILSAVRAYVAGESLYSKGQKDAQVHLLAYAQSHDEADYQRFLAALAIPIGDRLAREELQRPEPDLAQARAAFLQGGNHPDDVPGMIRLFRGFERVPFMAAAISTWTEGDAAVEQIRVLAAQAHARISAGQAQAAEVQALRDRSNAVNDALSVLQRRFSAQLGEAARTTQAALLVLNVGLALLLTALGVAQVRRTAAALREREALAAASNAKTQFLSRMSHELRTPLNAVLGFAQLLRTDPVEPPTLTQANKLDHIETAGRHLLSLVNEVLDLTRVESGQMSLSLEPVALGAVVDEALTMVSPLAAATGVTVQVASAGGGSPASPAWVRADRVRLLQVLVNLLSNAIKYNRAHGTVSVDWAARAGHWVLRVVDSGPGISVDRQTRLFEPFNRLGAERSRVEGTGIGLVLARGLTRLMGGELAIDSEPGRGTTATLTLVGGAPPPMPLQAEAPAHEPGRPGERFVLLYAEDNEVNAELVRQVLRQRPAVDLRVAENGARALGMARADPPDLMLVDMNLGDMTGFELLRALRRQPQTAHIPLVALSADALPDQIDKALAAGFARYWTKPIDFPTFLSEVDALIAAR